jgi:hypothetical protein
MEFTIAPKAIVSQLTTYSSRCLLITQLTKSNSIQLSALVTALLYVASKQTAQKTTGLLCCNVA